MADALTPEPAFNRALAEVRTAYERRGALEALRVFVEPTSGHSETPGHREQVLAFLMDAIGTKRDHATPQLER